MIKKFLKKSMSVYDNCGLRMLTFNYFIGKVSVIFLVREIIFSDTV